ncbi:MAG: Gfo/Idh/MocA family oxidoreductase [Planctomycetes bacterium]|nr:Gfo/Idh/MocA family oxidoreductase [Planctomycetota bacterium]
MVRLGFIGCGGIAKHHMRHVKQVPDAQVVSCADINEQAAAQFAQEFGVAQHVTDFRAVLDNKDVDAVFVCTPTFLHHEAVVAAAQAGKHVFCEKPIAMSLAHAREMIKACKTAKVKFMIGFVRRFDADWGKFREIVQSGLIGRPVLWRDCASSPGPASPWFLDKEKGGGPLIDGAVHNYDFARYTFGEAALVQGSMNTFKSDSTALDTGTGIVRFKSGDQLMMSWSWGLPKGCKHGARLIDLMGPAGGISFGVPADKYPAGVDPKTHGGYVVQLANGEQRVEVFPRNNMFLEEVKHFVDCVQSGKKPSITGEDGLRALEIGLAVLKSSQTGKSIKLRTPG